MRAILRSSQYAFLECLAIFPFLLWINSLFLDNYFDTFNWIYFPLIYVATSLLGRIVKKDYYKLATGFVVGLGLVYIMPVDNLWPQIVILILFFVSAIRGFQYGQKQVHGVLPIGMIWSISLPSYFISYILYSGADFVSEQQLLTTLALILLFFLLFLTNQEHLSKASLVKSNVKQMNKKIKHQNYFYVLLFFVSILLLTRYNPIASFLVFIFRGIFRLLGILAPEESNAPEPEINQDQAMPDFGPGEEPSRWAEILDQILIVFGTAILIFVSLFVIYQVLKRIPFFAKKLKALGQQLMRLLLKLRKGRSFDHDLGYQDETESVFDLSQSMDQFVDRVKSRFTRGVDWENLTDKEKARSLFRQVVKHARKQGFTFRSYETAQESITRIEERLTADQELTNKFASVYDQARYSSLTIDQIEELKNELKQIGWIS